MKIKTCFCIFCLLFLMLTCQKSTRNEEKFIQICTSVFPLSDIVQKITPASFQVNYAVPIGANPHTFEPNPELAMQLRQSDVFIGADPHLDGWITKFLNTQTKIFYLTDYETKDQNHQHNHHYDQNPHVWLSLNKMKRLLPLLSHDLENVSPEYRPEFVELLSRYLTDLDSVQNTIYALFDTVSNKYFIQWHDAWHDFADENGLKIAGTLEHGHGDQPSLKEFNQLVKKARSEKVKVIVVGLNIENTTLKNLRKTINGDIVRLDTIGDPDVPEKSSYLKLMSHNARRLAIALNN